MNHDSRIKNKISNLPKTSGVYEFLDKQGKILYIGKATSLKDRTGSYFLKNAHLDRPNIEPMMAQIADIKIYETDSVLEALILEANLIKKHQPKYNIDGKDDKSFVYAVITKEKFSRVLIVRETELYKPVIARSETTKQFRDKSKYGIAALLAVARDDKIIFGPYTSKKQLEIALKLIRKIFPYHSAKQISRNCCFDHQVGLCPGPHVGAIGRKDYMKNIKGVRMIFEGRKKNLVGRLKREMKDYAKNHEYEKAAEARNRIFSLKHIRDVTLISEDMTGGSTSLRKVESSSRIEAYDISNIAGDYAVGSMIVFTNGKVDKNEYRKFKIKTVRGIDDVGMMREVLYRRFHNSWPKPDLIVLDGGKGHLNMAQKMIDDLKLDIPVIAVAKGPTRKISNFKFQISNEFKKSKISNMLKEIIKGKKLLSTIISEAHRFAISYHKKLRGKNWKEK